MPQPTTVTKVDVWNALKRISAADNREQLTAGEEQHIAGLLKSLLATGVALNTSFLTETDEQRQMKQGSLLFMSQRKHLTS
jgi:hypothetical protein